MILSVSPNVALNRIVVVHDFALGQQSRARFAFWQPGGSGCHASVVIRTLGAQTLALGFIGGHTGALWRKAADESGLPYDMVETAAETRISYCIVDPAVGSVVESVEEGPQLAASHLERLKERLLSYLPRASLLILSGSLPRGLPPGAYVDLIRVSRAHGVRVLADIHSEPLALALPHKPWLIKPNLDEFHRLLGRETATLAERAAGSRELAARHVEAVVLSMAGEGVLLTTEEEQWHLQPPALDVHLPHGAGVNVIGCGDALVGALATELANTGDLLKAAKLGLAAAHLNLATYGVPEVDALATYRAAAQVPVRRL